MPRRSAALDAFGLLMIEQPLHHDDLVDHAELQRQVCARRSASDESIRSAADASAALELGACRIVNIKQGRVGGVLEARRVHDVAARARRAGVVRRDARDGRSAGRRTSRSRRCPASRCRATRAPRRRYFAEDLTEPFELAADGTMAVPTGPGIGVEPAADRLEAVHACGSSGSRKSDKNAPSA